MNTKTIWVVVGVIVLVAIGCGIYYFSGMGTSYQPIVQNQNASTSTDDLIHVTMPLPDVLVQSPLLVKGEARGTWYFEASFPVKILDANGQVLGQAPAQAQGDWMTTDFVPFQATLQFTTPTTEKGTVLFQKDNPSGVVLEDMSVSVPVYFSANASKL